MTLRDKLRFRLVLDTKAVIRFFEYVYDCHNKPEFFTRKAYRNFKQNYKTERQLDNARLRGAALERVHGNQVTAQSQCNHLKGGYGAEDLVAGNGGHPTSSYNQYAIADHTFANGDRWITCLRCRKRWKPGTPGYEAALQFPTNNVASTALQFRFSDGGKKHRELTSNS